jgi:hypothetical protein
MFVLVFLLIVVFLVFLFGHYVFNVLPSRHAFSVLLITLLLSFFKLLCYYFFPNHRGLGVLLGHYAFDVFPNCSNLCFANLLSCCWCSSLLLCF